MKRSRYYLFLLLIVVATAVGAQPKVQVFELKNRQSAEITDQLKALYPDQDVVFSADGQRLMVKAEAQVLQELGGLIQRLDVAPVQMRITVRRQQANQSTGGGSSRTISTVNSRSDQSIVVLDGETARIESGVIRQVTRAVQGGDSIALIAEDTPMTEGFLVQPRALGTSQVELRVASFNNSQPRHRAQGSARDTAAVLTMRRAMPGEWVPLGSTAEESASERGGRTYSTGNSDSNQNWSIKVDILE